MARYKGNSKILGSIKVLLMSDRLSNLSIRQLRAISALARHGSVTAAARALNLSQPAITLQLRKLQDLAELPLMQRSGEGLLLTDAGRELQLLSERIAAAIHETQESLDIIAGRSGGRVAIGAVSTAKYFMPFAIAGFSRKHPKIRVELSIGNRREIMDMLRDYRLDFAIMGRPPPDVAVEMRLIGDHPHILIAPVGHPLARSPDVSLADVASQVLLTREVGSGTRLLMEELFEQAGVSPTIGMEFDSNETIKQGVLAGLGIAFLSAHTVATEVADGRLTSLDVPGLPVTRQWFVIRRSDKILLPPAAEAFEFMSREAASFLPMRAAPAG